MSCYNIKHKETQWIKQSIINIYPADQPEEAEPDWSRHNVCAVFAHLGASSLTGLTLRVNEASLFERSLQQLISMETASRLNSSHSVIL